MNICLTLCLINYNGERYLEESLGSVIAQRGKFKEILLIDNASVDKSLEIVNDRFPGVKVVKLGNNLGPGAARNVGFKTASNDLILFMDNDVYLSSECPDRLLKAIGDNPLAAVAMPRVLYADRRDLIQYDGADSHILGLMTLHNVNQPVSSAANSTRKISSLVTACFLVDRRKWEGVDPFDDSFIFNYEDHDFGLRTRIRGYEVLSVPSACCYHGEGTDRLSLREGKSYSRVRVYCLIRNRWQLILKNYQFKTIFLLSPMFFVYEAFQLGGVIGKGWFSEWLKALFWIFSHPVEILEKRRIVQKSRKTPDREILVGGPVPYSTELIKSPLERAGKNLLDFLAKFFWSQVKRFI
ncbi:MAG TPA: glycosyltransferase family 2 protein [Thermodesulfobacteriota bacterium]|nr:glycosyltransferase family 2 protein [Thermodesulfobacteriota bacterium]